MENSDIPHLLQAAITSTDASICLQELSPPRSLSHSKETHAGEISDQNSGRETIVSPYPSDASTLVCAGDNKTSEEQGIKSSPHSPEHPTTNIQSAENVLPQEDVPEISVKSITVSPHPHSQDIVSVGESLLGDNLLQSKLAGEAFETFPPSTCGQPRKDFSQKVSIKTGDSENSPSPSPNTHAIPSKVHLQSDPTGEAFEKFPPSTCGQVTNDFGEKVSVKAGDSDNSPSPSPETLAVPSEVNLQSKPTGEAFEKFPSTCGQVTNDLGEKVSVKTGDSENSPDTHTVPHDHDISSHTDATTKIVPSPESSGVRDKGIISIDNSQKEQFIADGSTQIILENLSVSPPEDDEFSIQDTILCPFSPLTSTSAASSRGNVVSPRYMYSTNWTQSFFACAVLQNTFSTFLPR